MVVCPHCHHADPGQTAVCPRCGGVVFPLPGPMIEPIASPEVINAYDRRCSGCLELTIPFDVLSSEKAEASPPRIHDVSPATVIDLSPPEPLIPDGIAKHRTAPATPGLPGHPMNDSALQNPPMTVPATDRADSQPAPVPVTTRVRPRLVVLRGLRIDVEYPVYEGRNTIGRFADKPVDIDLMNQESVEQIWCSRQHAVITCEAGAVAVEDLNSLNGTWVNGVRIHPGQRRPLKPGDVLQIGTVQMKLVLS